MVETTHQRTRPISARIAFLLQTHDTNPHLERLTAALLQFPESRIFCHHDFSQHDAHPAIKRVAEFCQPFRITRWGRTSLLLATLDLLKLALDKMPEAEWFVLLSASCYPIKSATHIQKFLGSTRYNGFLDINAARPGIDLPGWWWSKVFTRTLVKIPFVSRKGKFYLRDVRVRRVNTPFSDRQPLMFGAQWFILRRNLVEHVMEMNPTEHPILRFYDDVENAENRHMASDESLLHCLLADHERHGICRDNLRYIDWENAVNWHPQTLTHRHWEAIRQSNALFARKFAVPASDGLLDCIDGNLLGV